MTLTTHVIDENGTLLWCNEHPSLFCVSICYCKDLWGCLKVKKLALNLPQFDKWRQTNRIDRLSVSCTFQLFYNKKKKKGWRRWLATEKQEKNGFGKEKYWLE